jgi:hypothetical protein
VKVICNLLRVLRLTVIEKQTTYHTVETVPNTNRKIVERKRQNKYL